MNAPRRKFALALAAGAAVTLIGALSAFGQSAEKLFFIQRSKNANEVHYDARLGADGALERGNPIDAYWLMKAKGGERESIGVMEKIAYGYDVDAVADGKYTLKLKAFKDRPLTLEKANGKWRARVIIAGKEAYLRKIYVASDESGMMPKVLYVDLHGEDASTGAALKEHVDKK